MDANEALADLTQISVQISNALIQAADGTVLGSTLGDDASQRLARLARELWEAADRTRGELGRDELAHLEVATPEGSVFLVHDGVRSIVATTSSDPTVGLVFYDLKACLRAVAESDREPEPEPEAAAEQEPEPEPQPEPEPEPQPQPEPEPEPEPEPPVEPEGGAAPPRPFSSGSAVFHRDEEEINAAAAEEQQRMLDGERQEPDEDGEDDGQA
jgi:predicted regulator of Ras-like GTPase activity (Roadblock/LC7/MglB family)